MVKMSDVYNGVSNNYISKNFEDLKKLENNLFRVLINTLDDSVNNRKYTQLAKFLVQRITAWKLTPAFPIYLQDTPIEVKRELNQLAEPELYYVMDNLVERIFKHSLRNKNYFSLSNLIKEIRPSGLLRWRLI
jgi:hypothetical protein